MKRLSEMMKERQLLSFELFPPKTDKGMENLPGTIKRKKDRHLGTHK